MDFSSILTYLLTDKFVFVFFRMLLNIISVIMLGGLLKSILKQIPRLKDSNWRRIIQMTSNVVFGAVIGYCIYKFDTDINVLMGASCGFISAVVYKISIKKIYDKCGVNCDSTTNASDAPPAKED